jgi:hypothetical protein
MDEYEAPQPTAPPVVGAIALGVAPLPLLAVYSVLFIAHGSMYPVTPPDITRTKHGELGAGLIALVLFLVMTMTLVWFMNQRRRWPFAIAQAATLVTGVAFVIDARTGPPGVPILLVITSATALVLSLLPVSGEHVHGVPAQRRRHQRVTAGRA